VKRIQALRQRFIHEAWALERMLGAAGASGKPPEDAVTLLGHILLSGRTWRRRLQGAEGIGESLWPGWDLPVCREKARAEQEAWHQYLGALTDPDLDAAWKDGFREGLAFEPRVGDVLEHVLVHAAHHRGQIARILRESGVVPVNTDYLNYLREEALRHTA